MKLHILSDLHREFAPFVPDSTAAAEADVVVLAGDIDLGVSGIEWAARAFGTTPVVYVCGNHELYGNHWEDTLVQMRASAGRCGIHFLENEAVVIGAVRFLGAALWTDFSLYGASLQEPAMRSFERGLNDCRKISAATPLSPHAHLTPAMVLERHEKSRAWLQSQLAATFEGQTVVVTHHAPSGRSVAPQYRGDVLTPGFASELPIEILQRADMWAHGHMHDSVAYEIAGEAGSVCKVVCNPRGYPRDRRGERFENASFDPTLLVEI